MFYQRILTVQDSLKCYLCSHGMWHTTGDKSRSRRMLLPTDTSSATYLHQDAGYVPQTHGRVIQKSFITPGQHGHVTVNNLLLIVKLLPRIHTIPVDYTYNTITFYFEIVIAWFFMPDFH